MHPANRLVLPLWAGFLLAVSASLSAAAAAPREVRTAAETLGIIRKVNDRWQREHPGHGDAFWNRAVYHVGNMHAYQVTREESYRRFSDSWARHNRWQGAKSDKRSEWRYDYGESDRFVFFGDWQVCFQVYVMLYHSDPKPAKIARAREVMEYQLSTPQNDYLWWSDGLFMVMPTMTELHRITGNPQYLEKLRDYFDHANGLMYDPQEGLFFRDAKSVYPKHKSVNGKKDFWSRGNGWFFAALPLVIDGMPKNHPDREHYLDINNLSEHPFLLTGQVLGGDGIRLNGQGIVSFDHPASYSGPTVINSGSAGPGVARALAINPFGNRGTVTIGQAGNSTTARLELENNTRIPNPVLLSGRNNSTPGILNNSHSNLITGTISAQVGGTDYRIRTTDGSLRLGGSPALTSTATGTRTFTLDGAAEGRITGPVANGSATVNLVKDGTGSWTLDTPNTYSETTAVNAGTLIVNGSTGTGTTNVASGATLAGSGSVRGINSTTNSWRGAVTDLRSLPAGNFSLGHGQTGTYFFRVRRTGSGPVDAVFGLSDLAPSGNPGSDVASPWNEYAVTLSILGDTTTSMLRANAGGSGSINLTSAPTDQWLNVWVSVNHADQTFRVATSTGTTDGTDSGQAYLFGRRPGRPLSGTPQRSRLLRWDPPPRPKQPRRLRSPPMDPHHPGR